jgi:hypothetical protein
MNVKTFKKPKDIGELLDIKNIQDTIGNFNNKQKVVGFQE